MLKKLLVKDTFCRHSNRIYRTFGRASEKLKENPAFQNARSALVYCGLGSPEGLGGRVKKPRLIQPLGLVPPTGGRLFTSGMVSSTGASALPQSTQSEGGLAANIHSRFPSLLP